MNISVDDTIVAEEKKMKPDQDILKGSTTPLSSPFPLALTNSSPTQHIQHKPSKISSHLTSQRIREVIKVKLTVPNVSCTLVINGDCKQKQSSLKKNKTPNDKGQLLVQCYQ